MSAQVAVRSVPVAALLALLMTACTPATNGVSRNAPPMVQDPAPVADGDTGGCNANAARWAIGKVAGADVVAKARSDAGTQIVRVLKPGQMVTMEYHASRLNIDVDDRNIITNVRCG